MANSDLKPKKFGYVVQPPVSCPHHHHNHPPHPVSSPPPIPPPNVAIDDILEYVNKYVDVRAKQLYDKLKEKIQKQIDTSSLKEMVLEQLSADVQNLVQENIQSGL